MEEEHTDLLGEMKAPAPLTNRYSLLFYGALGSADAVLCIHSAPPSASVHLFVYVRVKSLAVPVGSSLDFITLPGHVITNHINSLGLM